MLIDKIKALLPKCGNLGMIHEEFVKGISSADCAQEFRAIKYGKIIGYLYALLDIGAISAREFSEMSDYFDELFGNPPTIPKE